MRFYCTLWNVHAQKSQWPGAEWSKLPCKSQSFKTIKDIHHVMLVIYSDHTRKPAEWPTVCISVNQEERRHDKTPAHTINIGSLMASVIKSWVVDIKPVWHLSITVISINRKMMPLQQFLPARSQASCSSVSRSVPRHTGHLKQLSFFLITLLNFEQF